MTRAAEDRDARHTKQICTSGWVAQILMLLLVISFGVWGVADVFTGFGANDIAQVGNIDHHRRRFRRRYDIAVRRLVAAVRPGSSRRRQARQLGVPPQVLSQLIAEATLDDAAHDMGLSISTDTVGRA